MFFRRVWKSLFSRLILQLWHWRRYVSGQNIQYLLPINLGCYKWYQSQTSSGVSVKTLASKEGGLWDPLLAVSLGCYRWPSLIENNQTENRKLLWIRIILYHYPNDYPNEYLDRLKFYYKLKKPYYI